MPYKDKEQAREATKERVRRYREKRALHIKPVTPVTPSVSVTPPLHPNVTPLPNCPDGRYRPYSKEEQLDIKMSKGKAKKLTVFGELKRKYDDRDKRTNNTPA